MTNNQKDNKIQQLPLSFTTHPCMEAQDFMVTDCNREAYLMIDSWPNWLSNGLFIYGPKGCGKSHLAHIFAEKILSQTGKPSSVKIIKAAAINNKNVYRIADEFQHVIVDDLQPTANNEALFHLFNFYNTPERYMLWTAENPPQRMHLGLKDLQSRLNMLPSIAIKAPDDLMLRMLIAKLFNDRQLFVTQEIVQYILNNCPRSFAYIENLIEEIDAVSLAYQSAINYNIIKRAMHILQEKDQKMPDLFDER